MRAINKIEFPKLPGLQRSDEERQFEQQNETRMNQNFKTLSDTLYEQSLLIATLKEQLEALNG